MEIIQALLTPNSYSRAQLKLTKVKKIVIHWVGNANTSARANRNYFESLKNKKIYASSHYIVGLEGEILQCIPETEVAYHATTANSYSIGIENCHPDWEGKFNDKTYTSLIKLCADICNRYELNPETDIIRHYDVSKKICPKYYVNDQAAWKQLKEDVKTALEALKGDVELLEALEGIKGYGVSLDINIWGNIKTMNMRYAKILVEKLGRAFGKQSYRETIEYFVSKGCINTPSVWQDEKFKPEFCRALMIKVYNMLIK